MKFNIKKVRELVVKQQLLKIELIDAITNKDTKLIKKLFKKNIKDITKWTEFLKDNDIMKLEVISKLTKANKSAQTKILNNLNIFDNLQAKTNKELQRLKIKTLDNSKLFTFTTKTGRRLQLEYYTHLVATAAYVQNKNKITIDKMKSEGISKFKISKHLNACPICVPLEGKIFHLKDNVLHKKYLNLHIGCWHYIIPVK